MPNVSAELVKCLDWTLAFGLRKDIYSREEIDEYRRVAEVVVILAGDAGLSVYLDRLPSPEQCIGVLRFPGEWMFAPRVFFSHANHAWLDAVRVLRRVAVMKLPDATLPPGPEKEQVSENPKPLSARARDILNVMLAKKWTSPKRAVSRDRIAKAIDPDATFRTIGNLCGKLRKAGLIKATGEGCEAGTYLTVKGIETARSLDNGTE